MDKRNVPFEAVSCMRRVPNARKIIERLHATEGNVPHFERLSAKKSI